MSQELLPQAGDDRVSRGLWPVVRLAGLVAVAAQRVDELRAGEDRAQPDAHKVAGTDGLGHNRFEHVGQPVVGVGAGEVSAPAVVSG